MKLLRYLQRLFTDNRIKGLTVSDFEVVNDMGKEILIISCIEFEEGKYKLCVDPNRKISKKKRRVILY